MENTNNYIQRSSLSTEVILTAKETKEGLIQNGWFGRKWDGYRQ